MAVSIVSDTSEGSRAIRSEYGIPTGSASDVSIVQDDTVCDSAMKSFEQLSGKTFAESFVLIRIGPATPFFLAAKARPGALGSIYLLDVHFTLLTTFVGT